MEKMNIKKLAGHLQLSVATISKAMRDSHEISEETKKKVWAAAREFNYTPNPYASSLRRKKSKTIAIILPEVADNFFSLAINGIQAIAEQKGYHVLIYLTHESYEIESALLEECSSGRIDGLLISISSNTRTADHIKKLQDEKVPIVFFDRDFELLSAPRIITNDYECGAKSARLLLERGCSQLKFLSISESLPICTKRAEGFMDAICEASGRETREDLVYYCHTDPEISLSQIEEVLLQTPRPDGIVASVERIGIQVYLACRKLGLTIPKDVKLVAFSTVETASILNPSLTTITQPAFEIGKTAAETLFMLIAGKDYGFSKKPIVIPSVLIERDSTA
jgi:LacI family transcriptional regulator